LLPPKHRLRNFVQQQLQQCEQLLALDQRAACLLAGQDHAKNAAEQLQFAEFCRNYHRHHAAARLYAAAFTAKPSLPGTGPPRWPAAASAVLAAAGQGRDAATLPASERVQLRRQALDWMRADLQQLTQTATAYRATSQAAAPPPVVSPLEKLSAQVPGPGPANLLRVHDCAQHWLMSPELASVRDEKELPKLSPEEQTAWHKLWDEVHALDQMARAPFTEKQFIGKLTSQRKEQVHEVPLRAGKTYAFDLESEAFDAFLRLEDAGGKKLAENDSIEPGVNQNSRIVFTPETSGSYRLAATAFKGRGTGPYTLVIREFVGKK
jgi:hypothetical protein